LILAAPDLRRNWRSMLPGTLAMAVLEVALLLITVKILVYKSSAQFLQSHEPVQGWLSRYGEYLAVNAIPYLLPFVVAIMLHRDLRGRIFQWAAPVATLASRSPNGNRAAKRKLTNVP